MSTQSIILRPRPYEHISGRLLLLPLLPQRRVLKPLPVEIWTQIFWYALFPDGALDIGLAHVLLAVCKVFKEIVLPLIYSSIRIADVEALSRLHGRLHAAEQSWDSIRRIPYSAPGRWVQVLDVSTVSCISRAQALQFDSLLTQLFPLVPFLAQLSMNSEFTLSRRAVTSLGSRDGVENLRVLKGIAYVSSGPYAGTKEEPIIQLLHSTPHLEELDVHCNSPEDIELDPFAEHRDLVLPEFLSPLLLDRLHTLTLLSMHWSPLMLSLLHSSLPSLRKLTVTPYDDIPPPTSLVSEFIATHGANLRSLILVTPKSWPTRLHPSPRNLLLTSPVLRDLSLENPMPDLILPLASTRDGMHQLQILSIPRPTAESWGILQRLLPQLPSLCVIRARDVRWLRRGMTSGAQEAGIQGELREWRRRLMRRGIRVLDGDWQDIDQLP